MIPEHENKPLAKPILRCMVEYHQIMPRHCTRPLTEPSSHHLKSEIQPKCAKIAGKLFCIPIEAEFSNSSDNTESECNDDNGMDQYVLKMNELKDNQFRKANSGKLRV